MDPKAVSIVIIGRNEESAIGKCIEAALKAAEQVGGAEMIYVDSASTDRTFQIAESYGLAVRSLDPNLRRSPSAARYFGSHQATGEYVMFLDADTHVYTDFLPIALDHLYNDPRLAGVNGRIDDMTVSGEPVDDIDERFEAAMEVKWLRGPCCLYRSSALHEVGSFDPELATEEEAELGLRLVKAGWRMKLIPVPMACHTRCFHPRTLSSLVSTVARDFRSKRLGEVTRTIAHAHKAGNGLAFCWLRLKTTLLFLAWIAGSTLISMASGPSAAKLVLPLTILMGTLLILVKKRSISQTLLFIPSKIANIVDVLMGLPKLMTISRYRSQ